MSMNIQNELVKHVSNIEYLDELFSIPWKIFYDKKKRCNESCGSALNVIIINSPCFFINKN